MLSLAKTQALPAMEAVLRIGDVRSMPGYAHGLHAPSVVIHVEITAPARWREIAVRGQKLLAGHLPPVPEDSIAVVSRVRKGATVPADIATVLACLARVNRALQEAAGLPAFGKSHAIELPQRRVPAASGKRKSNGTDRAEAGQWLLAVPTLSGSAAVSALVWTARLFTDLAKVPDGDELSPAHRVELQRLLERMSRHAPRGTNNRCFLSAAHELGIPSLRLPGGIFQYGWSRHSCWLDSTFTEATSRIATRLARSKSLTNAMLRRAGVPVPAHRLVHTLEEAVEAAKALGFPVVVKPEDQDGGAGVSAGLVSEDELRMAFERARRHAEDILVEKHVEGRDYRVYVHRGRTLWAMERTPASVTGDGHRSVKTLVDEINLDPRRADVSWAPMAPILLDEEALELLTAGGMNTQSVPEAGRSVRLRRAANVSTGGTPVGVFDRIHPDNARLCERAADVLRLDLAGVDLLMPDIERSWHEVGAAICEVNAQPQLSGATAPHTYGQLLSEMVPAQGRVPVIVILTTGPDAALVQEVVGRLARRDSCAGSTSSTGLRIGEQSIRVGRGSVFQDVRTLLLDTSVDALVIGTDGREFLSSGLPVDRIDALVIAEWPLPTSGNVSGAAAELLRAALTLFKPYCAGDVLIARNHPAMPVISSVMGTRRVRTMGSVEELLAALTRPLPAD
ncbi:MAG: acetate--CoA ligase family protein [Gammaproteobacteria bacterium]